jgi:hypothetical protein
MHRGPFPDGAAVIGAAVEMTPGACLSTSRPAVTVPWGAMGADERLPRLVPRQSSELFEKLSLPGQPFTFGIELRQ